MGHEKRVPTLAQVFRIALLKGNSVQSLGSVNPLNKGAGSNQRNKTESDEGILGNGLDQR